MNLAQILYDAYPHSDLLPIDPQSDLQDLKTFHRKVTSTNIGDGLFAFLVIELGEGDGNLDEVIRLLRQAHHDIDVVLQAVISKWVCCK